MLLGIRLVTRRKIYPCFLIYNATLVREFVKAVFAVIMSHTALTNAAEGHLTAGKMNDAIVYTSATETAFFHNEINRLLILGEAIKCKRMRQTLDLIKCGGKVCIREYRKDRSEYLFLHNSIIACNVCHHGGCYTASGRIGVSANYNLFLIYETNETVIVLFGYDLAVICVFKRTLTKLSYYFLLYSLYKSVADSVVANDMIGCNAGLTAVNELSENNASGSEVDLSGFVYYARTLATKLQSYRCQMFCGGAHDFLAYLFAAGKEYFVKVTVEKIAVFLTSALYNTRPLRW